MNTSTCGIYKPAIAVSHAAFEFRRLLLLIVTCAGEKWLATGEAKYPTVEPASATVPQYAPIR